MSAQIEGVPPVLARAASDLKEHGHALPDALALTVNTLRTVAAGKNGKPSYAQRNGAREIITEFTAGKSKLSPGLRKGVERIEASKKPLKRDEVHGVIQRAEHRLALHEGVLLALDKASPGEEVPARLLEAATKLVGECERDEMRDRLKQSADADRALAEMFRLVEAAPRSANVNPTRGENLKATSEMSASDPEFERLHPRAEGKFAPKGGAEESSRPASQGRTADAGREVGPSPQDVNDLLGQLGFDSGDLAAYQSSVNLKPTGEIDAVTYEMMKRQVAIRNAGPKKGEMVLSADQPSTESGPTNVPPRAPRTTTKAKSKKRAKKARVVQAAERIEEAELLGRGGAAVGKFDPKLHPRGRGGRFIETLSKLRIGQKMDVPGGGGATITRTKAGYHYVPDKPGRLGGPTLNIEDVAFHAVRYSDLDLDPDEASEAVREKVGVAQGVDWFAQGRKDAAAGKHKPPPSGSARALADYNQGHYVGEKESKGAGSGKDEGGPDDYEDPLAIERHQDVKRGIPAHIAQKRKEKPETYKGYTIEQEPDGQWGIAEDKSRVFKTSEAVKRYIDGPAARLAERDKDRAEFGKRLKKRKPSGNQRYGHDLLTEATVINNAMVGGSVTGTRTAWGGVVPLLTSGGSVVVVEPEAPLVTELMGIRQQLEQVVEARKEAQTLNETRTFTRLRGREVALRERLADLEAAMRELQEVKSSAYPGLDRSKKENWVDKAGGLPSYIERIAKHLHYEQGMTISHAIASAVNTVKKWCSGATTSTTGGVQTANASPDTKAKACAAVAQWEAKKGKAKLSEAIDELVEAARAEGAWYYPSFEECAEIIAGTEAMSAEYPPIREALRGDLVHWDPKLHPRNRLGEFTDVLGKLTKGGKETRAGAGKTEAAVDYGGGGGAVFGHGPRRMMPDEVRSAQGMGAGKARYPYSETASARYIVRRTSRTGWVVRDVRDTGGRPVSTHGTDEDAAWAAAEKLNKADRGAGAGKGRRELSVPEKHQLRVARHTLKVHPSMSGVMGGPSRAEAINIIEKLTGERPTDPHAETVKAMRREAATAWDEAAHNDYGTGEYDAPGRSGMGAGKPEGGFAPTDMGAGTEVDLKSTPLYELASMIERDWSQQGKGVNYAARPYLDALHQLSSIKDNYYADSGDSVVAYFLSNATSWRGETAKKVKAELKRRLRETVDGGEFVAKLDKLEEATAERMAAHTYGNTEAFVVAQARERLLREQLQEAVLTSKARENLPSSAFVFPARKGYPIHDKAHGANALARASGKSEYSTVKKAVCAKYPDLPACKGE